MSRWWQTTYRSHPGEEISAWVLGSGEYVTWQHPAEVDVRTVEQDVDFDGKLKAYVTHSRRAWVNGVEVQADTVKIVRHVEWYEDDEWFRRWMEERW